MELLTAFRCNATVSLICSLNELTFIECLLRERERDAQKSQ